MIHTAKTRMAMRITAGTKTADTLSAMRAMGALVAAASLTMLIIWAKVVSSPTRRARARMKPLVFMVAALTRSPGFLSTGTDSPVRADSSTAVSPSMISPSTGTDSPGFTRKMSPLATSSTGMRISFPSLSTRAGFGAIFMRLFRASVVRPLEMDSSSFPTVMRAGIMAADSK